MQQITNVSIDILKVHPRNQEFYDDIDGETYEKFKKSLKEDGILTPLIVSPDMTIISGHQRYKGAKDLNFKLLPVIIREDLESEEEKLKKLLATNFGRLKNNPVKQGKVYSEYEKLCGVRQGSLNNKGIIVGDKLSLTQNDIAKELGVDVRTIQRLKKLQTLSPDLQQLIEDGSVKYTTALNIFAKISKEEQTQLINEIGQDTIKEMTSKQIQQYINEKQQLEEDNKKLHNLKNNLIKELEQERNKEPKVITKTVEVDKTDYSQIERMKDELEDTKNQLEYIENEKDILQERVEILQEQSDLYEKDSKEYEAFKSQINQTTKNNNDLGKQIQAITNISELVVNIQDILTNKLAPIKYNKDLLEAKDDEIVINNLREIIQIVENWCFEIKNIIPSDTKYVDVEVI